MRFINRLLMVSAISLLQACSNISELILPDDATDSAANNTPVESTLPDVALLPAAASVENPSISQQQSVSPEVKARYQEGVSSLTAGNLEKAGRVFSALHEQYPHYSGPLVNLGVIAEAQQRSQDALQHYSQAIEANPYNQQAYNRLGLLQRRLGDFSAAEDSYLDAIKVWPSYAPVRRNLAILYDVYMGRWVDAMHQYEAYQTLLEQPDGKVKGWMADLKRRIMATEAGQ